MSHVITASRDHRRRLGQVTTTLIPSGDTQLVEDNPNNNYASNPLLAFGYKSWVPAYNRVLVQWDLSTLAGKKIVAARFRFYCDGLWGSNVYAVLHRILPANHWLAAQATWNNRKTGTAWAGTAGCSTAGTDYDATAANDEFLWTTPAGWKEIPLNADGLVDLAYMATATANNRGFVLFRGPSGGAANRANSSEAADSTTYPQLLVTYEP